MWCGNDGVWWGVAMMECGGVWGGNDCVWCGVAMIVCGGNGDLKYDF